MLPAGFCLEPACARLLCSAPPLAPGVPWEQQLDPCCWQRVRTWLGAVLGSVSCQLPMECPCGHGREPGRSGSAQGPWCCAPGAPSARARVTVALGALLALPVLLQPPWAPLRLGMDTWIPTANWEATGGTQLQPCANKPLITAGLGWGFPPFPSRSHRDL